MRGPSLRRAVVVNRSYAHQRITGQQRYAAEIAARLLGQDGFVDATPTPFWSRSTLRTWAWVQAVLPWISGPATLLSMTARAPLFRRRHVIVVHDLFVLTNPEWFSRAYYWTHAPLLWVQLRFAAAVVAVSEPVARQVRQHYKGTVAVAPNAPSEVFGAEPAGDDVTARLGLTPGHFLLAVGSLDPRKNLRRLAEAYAGLTEDERHCFPLVLVGGGNDIFRQQDLRWPDEAVSAGYVSDEQLAQLYRDAAGVVLVSLAEGFGLPLVEATAAGARTLVVSDIAVFRWICEDAAHYVDPLSVPSITEGLRAAMRGAPGGSIDLSRFDWDDSARTVAALCGQVLGEHTAVAA